ncbi:hypothetical protein TL16_g00045 [Triparma laevis f. inornata]|uniref:Metallo-beta-lactamase domain-containing protein n=1 Tax=Triparma laevis f. inornata TaxID=1714386 RepID=A0A9W7DM83_9STRA|nr:hypothetical protein TL16_g00045 [Triparma laevis f. inornata]
MPKLHRLSTTVAQQRSMASLVGQSVGHFSPEIMKSSSTAGQGTCITVLLTPNHSYPFGPSPPTLPKKPLKITFDMGVTPSLSTSATGSSINLISHGHVDHLMGMFGHARSRRMINPNVDGMYYLPEGLVEVVNDIRSCVKRLDDKNNLNSSSSQNKSGQEFEDGMSIVGVEPDVEFCVWKCKNDNVGGVYCTPFEVDHVHGHAHTGTCRSLGYFIKSRFKKKVLKKEYEGLEGKEIGKLKKDKVEIYDEEIVEIPIVTYTGDTSASGITLPKPCPEPSVLSKAFGSEIVLCELTYLEGGEEKSKLLADERKHMHVDSLPSVFRSHGWDTSTRSNQKVVFFHVSAKHGTSQMAANKLKANLPDFLKGRAGLVNNEWWQKKGDAVLWV